MGFDSFVGFPDDGRPDWNQDFRVTIPSLPDNVDSVCGWFDDTVSTFLRDQTDAPALIHIDCDIYSSTFVLLESLAEHGKIRPGLVIVLDEGMNYAEFAWNELLALYEVLVPLGLGVCGLAVHHQVRSMGVTLWWRIGSIRLGAKTSGPDFGSKLRWW